MHPFKYDFRKVSKLLKQSLIKRHNEIYDELVILKDQVKRGNSSHKASLIEFLDLYFAVFPGKIATDSKLNQNVFCCDLKDVRKLKKAQDGYQGLKGFMLKLEKGVYVDSLEKEDRSLFKIVEDIFDYSGNRQLFYEYLLQTEINICSYCLNQYAVIYEAEVQRKKEWKMTAQLDHLYPKSNYPFISLSINNLFPVCAHCNNRKGGSPIDYNPLDKSYKYQWNFDKCFEIKSGRVEFNSLDKLEIKSPKSIAKAEDLVDKLNYHSLYSHFDEYAKSFVERMNNFGTKGYRKNAFSILKGKDINAENKLKYFLSDQSVNEENIFKYPLTKFKIELYNSVKNKVKNK